MLEPDPSGPELPGRRRERATIGPERPQDEHAPDRKPGEEADLPSAAELDVGEALVPEPEPAVTQVRALEVPHDVEVVARKGAHDDGECHPEENVNEHGLSLGFCVTDRGRQEESGADPGKPDPDDGRLRMHVADRKST